MSQTQTVNLNELFIIAEQLQREFKLHSPNPTEVLAGLSQRLRDYTTPAAEPTKPSIDWSHVHPDYNWLARDADGRSFIYGDKPDSDDVALQWRAISSFQERVIAFASLQPGNCDWRDSLVQRPAETQVKVYGSTYSAPQPYGDAGYTPQDLAAADPKALLLVPRGSGYRRANLDEWIEFSTDEPWLPLETLIEFKRISGETFTRPFGQVKWKRGFDVNRQLASESNPELLITHYRIVKD